MLYYYRKRNWKYLLGISAIIIFGIILFLSNMIIERMTKDEEIKVKLWADAIYHKAELMNYTETFFDTVMVAEGKRAEIYAKAIQKVINADWQEDLTFYSDIITLNTTIPVIVVNSNGIITASVNTGLNLNNIHNIEEIKDSLISYEKLRLNYYGQEYLDVYFKESKIYSNLRIVLDNLIQTFFQEIVNASSVPVIITDSSMQKIITYGNLDTTHLNDSSYLAATVQKMNLEDKKIEINLPEIGKCYVLYEESPILIMMRYFPIFQFVILALFVLISYLLFSLARKSEQNQVWIGMSKETAHQLGTPISSLLAWIEYLRDSGIKEDIIEEMMKDIDRLEMIAERFSKIGSQTELKAEDIQSVLERFLKYIKIRIPKTISLHLLYHNLLHPEVLINASLFEWALENVVKNSVDAMDGKGNLMIEVSEDKKMINIDITDYGKGIQKKNYKTIFQPGYTTKSRGWGLGLSLSKRIIKEYHNGKIYVKSSQFGKTTIRIILKKYIKP